MTENSGLFLAAELATADARIRVAPDVSAGGAFAAQKFRRADA